MGSVRRAVNAAMAPILPRPARRGKAKEVGRAGPARRAARVRQARRHRAPPIVLVVVLVLDPFDSRIGDENGDEAESVRACPESPAAECRSAARPRLPRSRIPPAPVPATGGFRFVGTRGWAACSPAPTKRRPPARQTEAGALVPRLGQSSWRNLPALEVRTGPDLDRAIGSRIMPGRAPTSAASSAHGSDVNGSVIPFRRVAPRGKNATSPPPSRAANRPRRRPRSLRFEDDDENEPASSLMTGYWSPITPSRTLLPCHGLPPPLHSAASPLTPARIGTCARRVRRGARPAGPACPADRGPESQSKSTIKSKSRCPPLGAIAPPGRSCSYS